MRKSKFSRLFAFLLSLTIACSLLPTFVACQRAEYHPAPGRLAASGDVGYAIDNEGNLWGWAGIGFDRDDGSGKLGLEAGVYQLGKPVILMPGTKFTYVACDYFGTAFAIDEAGNLWSWGVDRRHIMGYETEQGVPCKPTILVEGVQFSSVSMDGEFHVLAIDVEGKLWAWGSNKYGQFGNGTRTGSATPVQVLPEMRFKQAVAGCMESYLIDMEGRLWTCGTHEYNPFDDGKVEVGPDGELVTVPGEFPYTAIPVQLMPEKRFISVAGGVQYQYFRN